MSYSVHSGHYCQFGINLDTSNPPLYAVLPTFCVLGLRGKYRFDPINC